MASAMTVEARVRAKLHSRGGEGTTVPSLAAPHVLRPGMSPGPWSLVPPSGHHAMPGVPPCAIYATSLMLPETFPDFAK